MKGYVVLVCSDPNFQMQSIPCNSFRDALIVFGAYSMFHLSNATWAVLEIAYNDTTILTTMDKDWRRSSPDLWGIRF